MNSFLQQSDFDKKFCVQNEVTDVYKVMSFRKLLRVSKKELALLKNITLLIYLSHTARPPNLGALLFLNRNGLNFSI